MANFPAVPPPRYAVGGDLPTMRAVDPATGRPVPVKPQDVIEAEALSAEKEAARWLKEDAGRLMSDGVQRLWRAEEKIIGIITLLWEACVEYNDAAKALWAVMKIRLSHQRASGSPNLNAPEVRYPANGGTFNPNSKTADVFATFLKIAPQLRERS